jgi:hypothetical protein
MARRIQLEPQLTIEELGGRYQSTKDPVERSRWHFLWLLARVLTAKVIAGIAWYSAYWTGRSLRRYNQHGPDSVKDLRTSHARAPGSWPHRSRTSWRQRCRRAQRLRANAGLGGRSPTGSASASDDTSVTNLAEPICGDLVHASVCRGRAI